MFLVKKFRENRQYSATIATISSRQFKNDKGRVFRATRRKNSNHNFEPNFGFMSRTSEIK